MQENDKRRFCSYTHTNTHGGTMFSAEDQLTEEAGAVYGMEKKNLVKSIFNFSTVFNNCFSLTLNYLELGKSQSY